MLHFEELIDAAYWSSLLTSPWTAVVHVIDFFLVVYLIHYFIKALTGTKLMTLVRGVFLFLFAQVVATLLGMQTISWLMNQVITYGVIAGVVIFAPELRSMLEKLGRTTHWFAETSKTSEELLIESFLKATDYMAPRKIGALVSVQRAQTLREYILTGIPLDADVTSQLLINIFIPNTPLHDGAVIIRENKIAVACAYLPLSENTRISKEFGTRHRAAIGLSEVSDAFTFIVSEETGGISVAYNGVFKHDLSREEFETELRQALLITDPVSLPMWRRVFRLRGKNHE